MPAELVHLLTPSGEVRSEILAQARVVRFVTSSKSWENRREHAEYVADALADYYNVVDQAAQREFCGAVVAYLMTTHTESR